MEVQTQYSDLISVAVSHGAIADGEKPLRWAGVADEVALVRAGAPVRAWLQGYAIIDFKGEDARAFLQGQISNDVFALADGQAQWQGYCQPQGRLLATFALVRAASDHFWALLPSPIAPAIAKRLTMFVLRSKVKVLVSEDVAIGFMNAPTIPGAASLPVGRAVMRIPAAQFEANWSEVSIATQPVSAARWRLAGIDAGIGEVDLGGQDLFVPQTIGWDEVGVNYKKGCYPGQEIVARAHYRGAVKRKPVRLTGAGALPTPGQEIFVAGDSVGNFLCASELNENGAWIALASLLPEVRKSGELRIDSVCNARVELLGPAI
jgi:tRNA-modifying protein YgfZ